MIETRYSIEYTNPNPETIASRLGKLFIYFVLTISITIAIIALILSNLPHDISKNITIKAQDFISSSNTATTVSAINEKLVKQKQISLERETALKKEIEQLSQENTIQHNDFVNQLKNNQKLKEELAQLSQQLKDEKLKRSQLAAEVTSLNRKNKAVSNQLDEKIQVAKDYAIEIKKREQKKAISIEENTPKTIPTPKLVEVTNDESNKPIAPKPNRTIVQKTEPKEKTNLSQIDAIVAAMKATNNSSSTNKPPSKETKK